MGSIVSCGARMACTKRRGLLSVPVRPAVVPVRAYILVQGMFDSICSILWPLQHKRRAARAKGGRLSTRAITVGRMRAHVFLAPSSSRRRRGLSAPRSTDARLGWHWFDIPSVLTGGVGVNMRRNLLVTRHTAVLLIIAYLVPPSPFNVDTIFDRTTAPRRYLHDI